MKTKNLEKKFEELVNSVSKGKLNYARQLIYSFKPLERDLSLRGYIKSGEPDFEAIGRDYLN